MERPVPHVGNGVRHKFQVLDRINVAIVDDHEIVRAGLKQALEREADIAIVGEARTGNEAVHVAETLRPHVMLLDVKLEDVEGPEVCRRVLAASPGTAVRSEEHTSELQSHHELVCRLLLEKKNSAACSRSA